MLILPHIPSTTFMPIAMGLCAEKEKKKKMLMISARLCILLWCVKNLSACSICHVINLLQRRLSYIFEACIILRQRKGLIYVYSRLTVVVSCSQINYPFCRQVFQDAMFVFRVLINFRKWMQSSYSFFFVFGKEG